MLITATTTSQKLQDMLTTADLELIKTKSSPSAVGDRYLVFLQNLGGQDVYVDFYKSSTTANGAKIPATSGEMSFSLSDLQDANLIVGGSTSAIRVLINK